MWKNTVKYLNKALLVKAAYVSCVFFVSGYEVIASGENESKIVGLSAALALFEKLSIRINLPENTNVLIKKKVDSYNAEFQISGAKLSTYIGNHPFIHPLYGSLDLQVFIERNKSDASKRKIICSSEMAKDLYSSSCLVYLGMAKDFPQYIRYSYRNLSILDKQKLDQVIYSSE